MLEKPLLFVDIYGVISLWGFEMHIRPAGTFHNVDGVIHFLSSGAGEHLLALRRRYDLVWCSGWEEKADEHLPHALGVPAELPFLSFCEDPPTSRGHWKLAAIDEHAGPRRALAWLDDHHNDACRAWAAARAGPTLLVSTVPAKGLTAALAAELEAWADGPARRDPPDPGAPAVRTEPGAAAGRTDPGAPAGRTDPGAAAPRST